MTKHLWFCFVDCPCELEIDEEIEQEAFDESSRYLGYFGKYLDRIAG